MFNFEKSSNGLDYRFSKSFQNFEYVEQTGSDCRSCRTVCLQPIKTVNRCLIAPESHLKFRTTDYLRRISDLLRQLSSTACSFFVEWPVCLFAKSISDRYIGRISVTSISTGAWSQVAPLSSETTNGEEKVDGR